MWTQLRLTRKLLLTTPTFYSQSLLLFIKKKKNENLTSQKSYELYLISLFRFVLNYILAEYIFNVFLFIYFYIIVEHILGIFRYFRDNLYTICIN